MLIKFKAPDPRAGTVAKMDSHRGQQLIDAGAAVHVKEDGSEPEAAASVSVAASAAAKSTAKAKK